MARAPRVEQVPPTRDQLAEGLLAAAGIYLREADLAGAVGESGNVFLKLEVALDRGRPRRAKGAAYFERRMELRG